MLKWFQIRAEKGTPLDKYNLALCYYYGKGIPQNQERALAWCEKAANLGNKEAQKKLIRLYQEEAEKGNAEAQCNLGICYYYGKGVKQDHKMGIEWCKKAANLGNKEAQKNLIRWYRQEAALGNKEALENLSALNLSNRIRS